MWKKDGIANGGGRLHINGHGHWPTPEDDNVSQNAYSKQKIVFTLLCP